MTAFTPGEGDPAKIASSGRGPQPPVARPSVDLDWTGETWKAIGTQLLDLVAAVSIGWAERRPGPPPDAVEGVAARFRGRVPESPRDLADLIARIGQDIVPCSAFNGHPRWFAYITASPVPVSVLGELVAAALNQNTALWRLAPAATAIELQTIDWIKELLGYPREAQGVFVSGGQMANIVAQAVARDVATPWDTRRHGTRGPGGSAPRVRIYTSTESHYCHQQAAELLGLGREAVREVAVDDQYRMRVDILAQMIAEDRARGDLPIAVMATAGTVGTGAVDPLPELRELTRTENLWLHVDGAYGAFATLAPSCPSHLRALAEADSVACDPHKWLYSPIDAAVVLVRRPGLLERSFAFHPPYLETAGSDTKVDLLERTPENTRPFRALKVWLALQAFGRSGYAAAIEHNLQLAGYLEELVRATPDLRLAAPRELSIVCWRAAPPDMSDAEALERLQLGVIAELERRGIATVSHARLSDGGTAIRACLVNFRTRPEDVELLVEATAAIGRELA